MGGEAESDGKSGWDSLPLLGDVDPALRDAVLEELPRRRIGRGETLIRAGTPADALYFVVSGRFSVILPGTVERFAEIGAGNPIGEIGFFAGVDRTADVVALRDSVVLELTREAFEEMARQIPALGAALITTLSRRLAETTQRVSSEPWRAKLRTVAVIPAVTPDLFDAFLEHLDRALGRTTRLFRADGKLAVVKCPAGSGMDGVADWLNASEETHGFCLFVTDPDGSEWTKLALRQADIALVVLGPDTAPEPSPVEHLAFDIHPPESRRLAILHPRRTQFATGTSRLLSRRPAFQHHHVALTDGADVGRLARFLTGCATGFIAGGGGALGAAHIGVYRACRDAGMTIDFFGGTSAGAAMSGAFAAGHPADDIEEQTGAMFVTGRVFRKPTIPRYSLIDHRPFDEALKANFGNVEIEDLWVPYFAVATNLVLNTPEVIRHGPLWQAIRASGSIPGILPPFFAGNGTMLVDGGLVDNLPVDVMHGLKPGPNIVSTCAARKTGTFSVSYDDLPGRGELARRMINPFGAPLPEAPGVADVIIRSLMANQGLDKVVLGEEDWLVHSPLPEGIGFMNWARHRELAAVAFEYMQGEIAARRAGADPLLAAFLPAGD